jgi:hypothetical protein
MNKNFCSIFKKELLESHKKAMVSGPFKSGKYHKVFFEKNPFYTDKDSPINKELRRTKSETDVKPFKPTSPPKTVRIINKNLVSIHEPNLKFILISDGQHGWFYKQISTPFGRSL